MTKRKTYLHSEALSASFALSVLVVLQMLGGLGAQSVLHGSSRDIGAPTGVPQPDRITSSLEGSRGSAIRLLEIRLAPDRIAERKERLSDGTASSLFGPDRPSVHPHALVGPGKARSNFPSRPLYHLHAALLI